MPIYEYECRKCGERAEIMQRINAGPKRKCPSCGELGLKKLISAAAFHLKGAGWYVTDFRDKDKKKGRKEDSDTKTESKTGETGTSEGKSESADAKKEPEKRDDAKKGSKDKAA